MSLDSTYEPKPTERWANYPNNQKIVESLTRMKESFFIQDDKIWYITAKPFAKKQA